MSAGVIASVVAPHTPRIGVEENAPDFQVGLIAGLRELGQQLRGMQPDLFVLLSSHWVSTFNWYTTAHERHEGRCIADEAPDLIPGVPYSHPGDPQFARDLAGRVQGKEIPCGVNDSPHYHWDYGSYVPMHYMDPKGEVPIVTMPSVICAPLDECVQVGQTVHEVAREQGKRVVFIASCALSHQISRGPALWPPEPLQEMDRRFVELVTQVKVDELVSWLPTYCRDAVAEMGGRPVSTMVGALQAMVSGNGARFEGRQIGPYAQSSGSGNTSLCVTARAA